MKKILFFIITLVTVLVVSFTIRSISNAGGTGCDLELVSSSSSLNPEQEFTVDLKLSNVTVDKGIEGVHGNLNFDSTAFEVTGITLAENWKNRIMLQSSETNLTSGNLIEALTANGQGEKTNQTVLTIKFKVKSDATAKSYNIQLNNAESKPIEAQVWQEFSSPITTTVTVKAAVTPTNNTVNNTVVNNTPVNNTVVNNTPVNNTVVNNTPVNNTVVNNTVVNNAVVNNSTNKTNVNSNESGGSTPFTGVKGGLGLAVVIALIAAGAAGIRYKKYNSVK